MGRSYLPFAATGIALAFIAFSIERAFPFAGEVLLTCSAAFIVVAMWIGFAESRRRRDPYSLQTLRELHEEGEPGEEEVEGNFDSILCRCCGEIYSNRIPVCPRCGSM